MSQLQKNTTRNIRYAFSLVEILIAVAILGILAAIAMPTFQSHATEAREAAAKDNLRILRNTIELYAAQHNGLPPGYINDTSSEPSAGFFFLQLLAATKTSGEVAAPGTPGYPLGPYLPEMPINPFNDSSSIRTIDNSEEFPEAATGSFGWLYKAATKAVRLDWPGTDTNGTNYYDY